MYHPNHSGSDTQIKSLFQGGLNEIPRIDPNSLEALKKKVQITNRFNAGESVDMKDLISAGIFHSVSTEWIKSSFQHLGLINIRDFHSLFDRTFAPLDPEDHPMANYADFTIGYIKYLFHFGGIACTPQMIESMLDQRYGLDTVHPRYKVSYGTDNILEHLKELCDSLKEYVTIPQFRGAVYDFDGVNGYFYLTEGEDPLRFTTQLLALYEAFREKNLIWFHMKKTSELSPDGWVENTGHILSMKHMTKNSDSLGGLPDPCEKPEDTAKRSPNNPWYRDFSNKGKRKKGNKKK